MKTINHNPEILHEKLYKKTPRKLSYSPDVDFLGWRSEVKNKLTELLGMPPKPVKTPEVLSEARQEHETFTEIRFVFESEPDYFVPCHLLIPKNGQKPFPVVICLQGHNSGMHLSLDRMVYDGDEKYVGGVRMYGLQAIKEGYAALVMEQRGFGCCNATDKPDTNCHIMSMQAIMLGRTLMGERVHDVMRTIDVLSAFPEVDINRVGCMGNSGGGTTTYYAACMDERIKIAMPSCSIGTFLSSIFTIYHCVCNFIPHILEWFEMSDLSVLIAPRKLILVNGRGDEIFPIEGAKHCFSDIETIYKAAGCGDNCRLVIGEEGHRFYPVEGWPVFAQML